MNSKFIGLTGLLVIDEAKMKKMLGCCKNSWPPEKNINKSKL
jgi:hypothetical protein